MEDITISWFLKLPGLFITIGVVLILIAILVFIITGSKGKKKKMVEVVNKEESSKTTETGDATIEPVTTSSELVLNNPTGAITPEVTSATTIESTSVTPEVTVNNTVLPETEPVQVVPVENTSPLATSEIVTITPEVTVNPSAESTPEVSIITPSVPEPVTIPNEQVPVTENVQEFKPIMANPTEQPKTSANDDAEII